MADGFLIGKGTSASNTVTTAATNASVGGNGNHGVLFVSYDPGVTISSIPADSKGNTGWALQWNITTGGAKLACYVKENWVGGSGHTVTVNFSGTAYPTAILCEGRGLQISGSIDVLVSGTVAGVANTPTAGRSQWTRASGTLAQADELVFFCLEANTGAPGAYESSNLTILGQEPDVNNYWTSGVGKIVSTATSSISGAIAVVARSATTSAFGVISFRAASSSSTYSYTGSGQVNVSGTPPRSKTKAFNASGQLSSSGAAPTSKVTAGHNYTGSGQVTISGTPPRSKTKVALAVGTLLMSGSPPRSRTKAYLPSGGITLSSPSGAAQPFLGAFVLDAPLDGTVSNPHTVTLGTTQAAGSSLAVFNLGQFSTMGNPTDNKGTSFGTALETSGYAGGLWSGFGMEIFAAASIAGGTGHTVSVSNSAAPLEHSLIVVEARNGGVIADTSIVPRAAAGAGVQLLSASVTVPGPALLISVWTGDGDAGTDDQSAAPDGAWTMIDSEFIANTAYIQCAVAVRQVSTAGTYTCGWTPTLNQGAIIGVVAITSTGGASPPYSKTKSFAAAGTIQMSGASITSSTGLLNKQYTGSGLLQSSGTPPRSKTKAFGASGSVALSGSPLRSRLKVFTASGAVAVSGAALLSKAKVFSASGAAVIAGAALLAHLRSWLASGSVQVSGAAATLLSSAGGSSYTGSGQVTISGNVVRSRTKAFTAAGGVSAAGAAVVSKRRQWVGAGSLLVSGAAPTTSLGLRSYIGSGIVQTSGVALLARARNFAASGNLLTSGAAPRARTKAYLLSGGVQLGGGALLAKLRQYFPSGVLSISGLGFTGFIDGTTTIETRRTLVARAPTRKYTAKQPTRRYIARVFKR